ncbi:MAG: helix-hairpin-helix domain-containing protein [Arachnia sp.]
MSPAPKASFDDELARARLAFISAGQPALGAPRRAVVESRRGEQAGDGDAPRQSEPTPPMEKPRDVRVFDRFSLTTRQVLAVLVVLLCGVVVTLTALGRSSASQLPIKSTPPVVVSPATDVPSASPSPSVVRVHVLGAVVTPGVVTVEEGAIVQDAVLAAGGLLVDADPAELNLAAKVGDGQQVIVGTTSEPRGDVVQQPGTTTSAAEGAPMNLNTATVSQLEELPGVGPVTAAAIVAWRDGNGGFSSVADLQEVTGIGPKGFAKLEPLVTV